MEQNSGGWGTFPRTLLEWGENTAFRDIHTGRGEGWHAGAGELGGDAFISARQGVHSSRCWGVVMGGQTWTEGRSASTGWTVAPTGEREGRRRGKGRSEQQLSETKAQSQGTLRKAEGREAWPADGGNFSVTSNNQATAGHQQSR